MSKRKKGELPPMMIAAVILTEAHIVTRDGRPCTITNVSGLSKGGVLQPGSPVALFTKVRDGVRAIDRTERVREILRTSLLSGQKELEDFLAGEKFELLPCGHQKAASAAIVAANPQPQPALQHA